MIVELLKFASESLVNFAIVVLFLLYLYVLVVSVIFLLTNGTQNTKKNENKKFQPGLPRI